MSSSISSSELGVLAASGTSGPRRFLLGLFAVMLLCIAGLWIVTANLRQGFLPGEYAMWNAKQEMVDQCRLPPTLLLGDSRAVAGYMPGVIPDSINLALGGASPIELYYLSEHILACPTAPRRVLLSISMTQLVRAEYFWDRSALFGFVSYSQLEALRRHSRALHDDTLFPPPTLGDVEARLNSWLVSHQFPSFFAAYLVDEGVVGRLKENRRIAEQTYASLGHHLYGVQSGSDGVSAEGTVKTFEVSPLMDFYLHRMLKAFAARGTQVIFMAAPVNQATRDATPNAAVDGYRHYIESLQGPGFRVVGDPMATWDDRWFGDSTHLNAAGAERFSRMVAQEVK